MIRKKVAPMMQRALAVSALALGLAATATGAFAQGGFGGGFPQQSGEEIYKGICQGCHMPDAKGAVGAGMYPALAGNKKLTAAAYPVLVIINGQKAMPSFGSSFSDQQIANVVNYIRTNFGNSFPGPITAADVKKQRPAVQ